MSQIADGTVKFTVRDSRLNYLLDILYPVGSIKITVSSTAPFSDLGFGTWEEVSKGRVLWGADDSHAAGSIIEAGLPNITGSFVGILNHSFFTADGAFSRERTNNQSYQGYQGGGGNFANYIQSNSLDASRSSSVYGKSDTVTPPSYVVHFWQRTA